MDDHGQSNERSDLVLQGGLITTTGIKATWGPGYQPVKIRAVYLIITTTPTVTPPVVNFYRRPTAGSETAKVLIKALNPSLAQAVQGNVIFADGLDVQINPGEDISVDVGTASTAGAAIMGAFTESAWEKPGNNARMVEIV